MSIRWLRKYWKYCKILLSTVFTSDILLIWVWFIAGSCACLNYTINPVTAFERTMTILNWFTFCLLALGTLIEWSMRILILITPYGDGEQTEEHDSDGTGRDIA